MGVGHLEGCRWWIRIGNPHINVLRWIHPKIGLGRAKGPLASVYAATWDGWFRRLSLVAWQPRTSKTRWPARSDWTPARQRCRPLRAHLLRTLAWPLWQIRYSSWCPPLWSTRCPVGPRLWPGWVAFGDACPSEQSSIVHLEDTPLDESSFDHQCDRFLKGKSNWQWISLRY